MAVAKVGLTSIVRTTGSGPVTTLGLDGAMSVGAPHKQCGPGEHALALLADSITTDRLRRTRQ